MAAALACSQIACGGSTASPSEPKTLTGSASLSGTVVGVQSRAPIAGASIRLATGILNGESSSSQTASAADGAYLFPAAPTQTLQMSLDAPGYLARQTWLQLTGTRTGVVVDMIANVAPFSLDFYRQFARNGYETPLSLQPIQPWTMAPNFHIDTRRPDGSDVPAAMIAGIERVLTNSVPELTGGHFRVATIETGTTTRPNQLGWVNVQFVDPGALGSSTLGNSTVGRNGGTINLVYDPALESRYGTDFEYHCEGAVVEIVDHEVVHTMGYYHTDGPSSDFQSGPGCPGVGRAARSAYHAAVMYSRPPGNVDPDADKSVFYPLEQHRDQPAVISCAFPTLARRAR